jgi:hypothetical protein
MSFDDDAKHYEEMQNRVDRQRDRKNHNSDYQIIIAKDRGVADVKEYSFTHGMDKTSIKLGLQNPQIKELKKQIEADSQLEWELERVIASAYTRGQAYERQRQLDRQRSIFPWNWRIGKHEPY